MMNDQTIKPSDHPQPTRAVQLLFAASQCLGIFAEEIEAIVDGRQPALLPDAPAAVLGVVSIRGRMLTVLDAAVLLGEGSDEVESAPTRNSNLETRNRPPGKIVRLRGDEQIALAVDHAGEVIELAPSELQGAREEGKGPLVLGVVTRGEQSIAVLNHNQLFSTAMRGRERRQRHF